MVKMVNLILCVFHHNKKKRNPIIFKPKLSFQKNSNIVEDAVLFQ